MSETLREIPFSLLAAAAVLVAGSALGQPPAAVVAEPESLTSRVPPWPVGPFLLLRGGGVIAGQLRELTADRLVVETVSLGRLELLRAAVAGYRSSPRSGPRSLAAADSPVSMRLANGDRLAAGTVTCDGRRLSLAGLAGMPAAGESLKIPLERVLAIDLPPEQAALGAEQPFAGATGIRWVALEDGTRLPCRQVAVDEGGAATGRVSLTPAGAGLPTPLACPAAEVAVFETDGAGLRLAGLGPTRCDAPDCWPLAIGQSVTGDWPRLRGLTGFTAIGLHAPAVVRYVFDRPVTRFTAVVGIDDSAGQGGSVTVRVAAGSGLPAGAGRGPAGRPATQRGGEVLAEVFRSPVLRGGDSPLVIDLPLVDATSLELQLEPADGSTVLDRTLWLDPQVWFE